MKVERRLDSKLMKREREEDKKVNARDSKSRLYQARRKEAQRDKPI